MKKEVRLYEKNVMHIKILVLFFITSYCQLLKSTSYFINIEGCANISPNDEQFMNYSNYWNNNFFLSVPWFYSVSAPNNASWSFQSSLNPIYNRLINIPCIGTTPYTNLHFDFQNSSGGLLEVLAVAEYCNGPLVQNGTTSPHYIYLNLPLTLEYGMTEFNTQYTWISSNATIPQDGFPIRTNTLLHELGHTFNLNHASSSTWEYGDCSCIMGCAADAGTLYNAPHSRALGMSYPVVDLTDSVLTLNTWYTYNIPIYTKSSTNHITITSSAMGEWTMYLSARSSDAVTNGADSHLNSFYDKVLSVHVHQETDVPNFTYIVAAMNPGDTIVFDNANIFMMPYIDVVGAVLDQQIFDFTTFYISIKLNSLTNDNGASVSIGRFTI